MPREDRPGEIWFAHALYVLCQNFVDYSTLYKIVRTALWFFPKVLTLRRSDLVHLWVRSSIEIYWRTPYRACYSRLQSLLPYGHNIAHNTYQSTGRHVSFFIVFRSLLFWSFGDKICPVESSLESITLERMAFRSCNILVFYHSGEKPDFGWSGSLLKSPWVRSVFNLRYNFILGEHRQCW